MSSPKKIWIAVAFILTAVLWTKGISREGIPALLHYAFAGVISGIALSWIAWSFASAKFTKRTAAMSLVMGLLIFTPAIALLLSGNDTGDASSIVLATTAGCIAAMGGALWSIMHLARKAFADWRDERQTSHGLSLGQAHR